jgi:CRISP-associated protein Cas1
MTNLSSRARKTTDTLLDDLQWCARSDLWNCRNVKAASVRAKRERPRRPLILSGHGVSLRVEGGSLAIRNGFTHYPQQQETYRFFKGELSIPERIIILDGSGSVSFDVLSWLAEQDVSLVRIDWRGESRLRGVAVGLCRQSLSGAAASGNAG